MMAIPPLPIPKSDLVEVLRRGWVLPDFTPTEFALAADEIEALRARVAELEKDAARYRWLRNLDNDAAEMCDDFSGIELDAAIDAAMEQVK